MNIYSTACPRNCYSTCSFKVHVDNGKIINIEPHPGNLATPEGPCLKGLSYVERVNSQDRLLYPLLRKQSTDKFHRISWDEALPLLADKLSHFKEKYGPQSILFYKASGMAGLMNSIPYDFWKYFGGCTLTYGDLCWPAGLEATRLTLGENKHNVPWDLENSRLIVMWGKNGVESNIQEMIPVENALDKGAKLIVIDPRRTPTADKADFLLQPRPGTDAALALGIARVLIHEDRTDRSFIKQHVQGYTRFSESINEFTPERVEEITGVPVHLFLMVSRLIGDIKPMTIIPGFGYQRYTNGGQTTRCILALQIITGNIGKPGACWHYANLQSYVFDEVLEPLSLYPPEKPDGLFRKSVSIAKLGVDILAAKDPELRMIWVERGNPVTQNPDTNNVLKAFRKLDFRIVIEQFLTDTAREADLILPAKSMFEQSDIIGSYWNPYVQLKQKVIDPPGEIKPESEIYFLLAEKLEFSEEAFHHMPKPGDTAVENWLSEKLEPYPDMTLEMLKEGPIIAPDLETVAFRDYKFPTPSGKIELYSDHARNMWGVNPLPTYDEPVEANHSTGTGQEFPFLLLTPVTKNRIHSQFGNLHVISQFEEGPFLEISPIDAETMGIEDGDLVRIFNHRGEIRGKISLNHSLLKGCLVMAHGFWISEGGGVNFLSAPRETDMGHGAAFHDNRVNIEPYKEIKKRGLNPKGFENP